MTSLSLMGSRHPTHPLMEKSTNSRRRYFWNLPLEKCGEVSCSPCFMTGLMARDLIIPSCVSVINRCYCSLLRLFNIELGDPSSPTRGPVLLKWTVLLEDTTRETDLRVTSDRCQGNWIKKYFWFNWQLCQSLFSRKTFQKVWQDFNIWSDIFTF